MSLCICTRFLVVEQLELRTEALYESLHQADKL